MCFLVTVIVMLSTLGIILYNIRGKISPVAVKLPAPAIVMIGYWVLLFQTGELVYSIIAIGMTIAFVGDTLLAIDLEKNMVKGIAAFAIAYLLFDTFILLGYRSSLNSLSILVAIVTAIIAFLFLRKFNLNDKVMKIAIPFYYIILISLVSLSSAVSGVAIVGAFFLFLCDSVIGYNTFAKPIPASDGISLTFYNVGHLLFYLAVTCQTHF